MEKLLTLMFGIVMLLCGAGAFAQETEQETDKPQEFVIPKTQVKPPVTNDTPQNDTPQNEEKPNTDDADLPPAAPAPKVQPKAKPNLQADISGKTDDDPGQAHAPKGGKDLTVRSEADRKAMLLELFAQLKAQPDPEAAELVAEEIWAVFLQSGSASVDYVLYRGIAAQNNGDLKMARRMYDHVLRLEPDYAEGWSRSGRLAAEEKNYSRAVADTTHALVLEPRHFYALWTLGNILEKLERSGDAYEVYQEAYKIYPMHKQIKERVQTLKEAARGKAL